MNCAPQSALVFHRDEADVVFEGAAVHTAFYDPFAEVAEIRDVEFFQLFLKEVCKHFGAFVITFDADFALRVGLQECLADEFAVEFQGFKAVPEQVAARLYKALLLDRKSVV